MNKKEIVMDYFEKWFKIGREMGDKKMETLESLLTDEIDIDAGRLLEELNQGVR